MAEAGRRRRWALWIGSGLAVLLLGLGVAAFGFAGPILRPVLEARASAALGRPVTIGRLQVSLGRVTTAVGEDVIIGNPPGFPEEVAPWLARIARVKVELEPLAWLRGDGPLVIPRIELERPVVEARQLEDGRANYLLDIPGGDGPEAPGTRIGALVIREGQAHVVLAPLQADFAVRAATEEPPGGEPPRILAEARGTYAAQPVEARLVGGGILTLRDADKPWPVRLDIANGPTELRLEGTLRDPLSLRGADLRLTAAGPDMALLRPISGVRFAATPPYRLTGRLDYERGRIRFMEAEGQIGRTDVSGGLILTLGGPRPVLAAELRSRRVDLRDLGGFVGAEPGRPTDPGVTPERREALARAAADPRLLPDDPINIPKLLAADVHVDYSAERIEGRRMPFDALVTQFDIVEGVVEVKRLVFPIGGGELAGRFTLTPQEDGALRAHGEVELRRADMARLLDAAAGVQGGGRVGGVAQVQGTGRSLAEILARGEGTMAVVMVGGTLSALLVDLSGLRFANALLSLLGLPERERVECLIGDFALRRGTLSARRLLLDTESAVVTGTGEVALPEERLRLRLRTEAKRFSLGTLPAPILVGGTLKNPSAGPEAGELAARAGAAAGLGVLLPPLALLPTIQLGVGENTQCERLQARGGRRER
jgi:hypothetical protein